MWEIRGLKLRCRPIRGLTSLERTGMPSRGTTQLKPGNHTKCKHGADARYCSAKSSKLQHSVPKGKTRASSSRMEKNTLSSDSEPFPADFRFSFSLMTPSPLTVVDLWRNACRVAGHNEAVLIHAGAICQRVTRIRRAFSPLNTVVPRQLRCRMEIESR